MARKGENIYKRKDGRWEGRYIKARTYNDKPVFGYVYSRSYAETKQKLVQAKAESNTKPANISVTGITYKALIQMWLCDVKARTKESTYSHYVHSIETHIIPRLGSLTLKQLSSEKIDCFIEELLENGRVDKSGGLSPKTVSDLAAIVRSTLRFASERGYDCPCCNKRLSIKKSYTTIRVLSKEEQKRIVKVLLDSTDFYKMAVIISLYMGLRVGEVCALRWCDLDLDAGVLHVRNTVQRIQNISQDANSKTRIIISSPKSQCSIRDIPIPDCIKPIIANFQGSPNTHVVSTPGKEFTEPRVLQYHFSKYVEKAGIDKANYHSLRHTFATRCVELGFELKCLSEILGHSNVNITLNRYVHTSMELKGKNMELLSLSE